ncbi:MAG: hypothetical protein HEQ20_13630 [Aphanizomenon flos-aquae KM1D3_PB]|uniref:hypothetical protein n=1 Tax=Aphanizomenon flos-aquae TaxID=1176 RepID=UPI000B18574A|nr:hypothetical protein [Aphanizomenon flos-aquae]QSV71593.1 MAG: hypothetical protein HEQ20_13630 [Aphanizomenon flos-aquae KM1D3_PB]
MANATLRYQEVGAQGLRPFRGMANATLRYQQTLFTDSVIETFLKKFIIFTEIVIIK